MGKSINDAIQVDALNSLLNSNSLKQITNDGLNVNLIKNNLTNFINDSSVLKGYEWNSVRKKISKYNNLLSLRAEVATSLSSSINSAVKMLLDYLGDDLCIEPSKLEEIQEAKRRCENLIVDLSNKINIKYEEEKVDEVGNITYKLEYMYNSAERDEFSKMLVKLRDETVPELNRLIEKINGLSDIYSEALRIIKMSYGEIENFNKEVNNLNSSDKITLTV